MVKQPAMEPSEFTMSHEDFPALPGVPASSTAAGLNSSAVAGQATNTIGDAVSLLLILVLNIKMLSIKAFKELNQYKNL